MREELLELNTIRHKTWPTPFPLDDLPDDDTVMPLLYIVRGNFSQFDEIFSDPHCQCVAMCVAAIGLKSTKTSNDSWTESDIDDILFYGDIYYRQCLREKS